MVRAQAMSLSLQIQGAVAASYILKYLSDLRGLYLHMQDLAAVPGVEQYARDEFDNQTYDIGAQFSAMSAQMVATARWIAANFPKDPNGYLLAQIIDVNGATTDRVLSPSDLAGLRAILDALVATISV